jgi:hypothetical protein
VCARGDGIRGSKDLRAEIGKFPNSTNERKKMSKKTNFKRVALVAVASLGFGVLTSVAPASATITAATGGFGTSDVTILSGKITAVADLTGSTTTMTAAISSGGSIQVVLATDGTASEARVVVSGGYIDSVKDTSAGTVVSASAPTYHTYGTDDRTVVVRPDAGATSMTISAYTSIAARTAGTIANALIVTVAPTTSVGSFSYADSAASVYASGTGTTPTTYVDGVSAALKVAPSTAASRINFSVKDVNGNTMSSALVQAIATGGCVLSSDGSTFTGTSSAVTGTTGSFYVARAKALTPYACTIALTVNGAAWVTKSITFQGKVTKVEVIGGQAGISFGKATGASSADIFYYQALDASGNAINGVTVTNEPVATATYTSLDTSPVTVVSSTLLPAAAATTCSTTAGSYDFNLRVVNEAYEVVKSPVYKMYCYGDAKNYKASFDKASYVPGDIATLTITATDSKGNPTNDYETIGTGSTTLAPSIAGSNMTAVTAPTSADTFTGGKKTYKYIVGSSEGSYQMAVDLPDLNNVTYSQTAVTAPYTIKASSASVSNADVLKSIVALIASINKQIQALQKLILKR